MIESIEFKNFKALKDTTLPLSPFTLIIGPNGSGKSTAIQALKAIRDPSLVRFEDVISVEPLDNMVKVIVNGSVKISLNGKSASESTSLSFIWTLNSAPNNFAHPFYPLLQSVQAYSLNARNIATPSTITRNVKLGESGENLAAILDNLLGQERERFDALNKEFGRLLPEFDQILLNVTDTQQKAISLRTRKGHYKLSARDLSEGTLLALALLTLAYLPQPPAIICLEEPDRGIHPRLLRDISDALNRLAYPESVGETRQPVQVIATTHSPYFLDLYKDFPEQVVIANKIGQEVKFERLSDRPHYEEIIQDASLGDAWYTGIFGGVPAHP
jgi:predicted ATPase